MRNNVYTECTSAEKAFEIAQIAKECKIKILYPKYKRSIKKIKKKYSPMKGIEFDDKDRLSFIQFAMPADCLILSNEEFIANLRSNISVIKDFEVVNDNQISIPDNFNMIQINETNILFELVVPENKIAELKDKKIIFKEKKPAIKPLSYYVQLYNIAYKHQLSIKTADKFDCLRLLDLIANDLNTEPVDWNNKEQRKYAIRYNYQEKKYMSCICTLHAGTFIFLSDISLNLVIDNYSELLDKIFKC
jgi:hypothetical protein